MIKIKSQTAHRDAGKPDPLLLFKGVPDAISVIIDVLDFGAQKYEPFSWRTVEPDRFDASARRHMLARDCGQKLDAESGLPHRAHEVVNLLFQLQCEIEQRRL